MHPDVQAAAHLLSCRGWQWTCPGAGDRESPRMALGIFTRKKVLDFPRQTRSVFDNSYQSSLTGIAALFNTKREKKKKKWHVFHKFNPKRKILSCLRLHRK